MNKFKYVGFWNGDIDNPEIVSNIPKNMDDRYKMVLVELTEIPTNKPSFLGNLNKVTESMGKMSLELKKLTQTAKKFPKW